MLAFALAVAGCSHSRRTAAAEQKAADPGPAASDSDKVWKAALESVRRFGFQPDRVDRRAGVITTLPEGSKHLLEFWRRDVATAWDLFESTTNPIRRWVEITFPPGASEGAVADVSAAPKIVVYKQRLSAPDRQFNSSGAAYQFFGNSLPSTTGAVKVTAEDDRWLPFGEDAALAGRLQQQIARRAGL